MSLRRHIAFAAILVASMVMVAHAVVPHHHRTVDLAVCIDTGDEFQPLSEMCSHNDSAENGVKCTPTLPFALKLGPDVSMDGVDVPLFICDNCTDSHHHLASPVFSAAGLRADFFVADARLLAQYVPGATAGRAPPVL